MSKKLSLSIIFILLSIFIFAQSPQLQVVDSLQKDSISLARYNKLKIELNKNLNNQQSDSLSINLDQHIQEYMRKMHIKGASLAIMRNDSLVYAKGFGYADKNRKMQCSNIMRIASVSKLVTAIAIMKLRELGKLDLSSRVFGPGGLLDEAYYNKVIEDKRIYDITVEHLLRHQAGFNEDFGDPMFRTAAFMRRYKLAKAPTNKQLLCLNLKRKLQFNPGSESNYSNVGYMCLSLIIQKLTGEKYETWVKREILEKAGCYDFHIANNYYGAKRKNEVRYYLPPKTRKVEEFNNSKRKVLKSYGGNDVRSLSGAGAWVASPIELAKLVAAIDGKDGIPDILSKESIALMTEHKDEKTPALGWNKNALDYAWIRTGSFSGTNALIAYYPDGECWLWLSNTSTYRNGRQARYTSALFDTLRIQYSSLLPKIDLFSYKKPEKIFHKTSNTKTISKKVVAKKRKKKDTKKVMKKEA